MRYPSSGARQKHPNPTPADPIPCAIAISFLKYLEMMTIPAILAMPDPAPESTPRVKHSSGIEFANEEAMNPSKVKMEPITVAQRQPTRSQMKDATGPIIKIMPVASELIHAVCPLDD